MLRGRGSGYGDACQSAGDFAIYQSGKVALPTAGNTAVDLASVLPARFQNLLADDGAAMMLSEPDARASLEALGPVSNAFDPVLSRSPRSDAEFLLLAYDAGVLELTDHITNEVGLFFAKKKSGDLRAIFDPRRVNALFRAPDTAPLASGESLGDLELSEGQQLWSAEGDVENCYYQYTMPAGLRPLFGLPPIAKKWLPQRVRDLLPHNAHEATFRVRVVPMGWSWAVVLVQAANLHQLRANAGGPRRWLMDRASAPEISGDNTASLLYIDNFAALGTSKETVRGDSLQMEATLRNLGLATHAVEEPTLSADLVGFHREGATGVVTSARTRFWKLALALEHVLSHPQVTGQELEKLLGHLTYAFLLRRELFAVFGAAYVYVAKSYTRRQPLWPSVLRELRWAWALLPLARADLRAVWHPKLRAFDASPWGFGVVELDASEPDVAAIGRIRERWRFKEEGSRRAPREAALGHLPAEPAADREGDGFENVSPAILHGGAWSVVAAQK